LEPAYTCGGVGGFYSALTFGMEFFSVFSTYNIIIKPKQQFKEVSFLPFYY
jgi:hypothetical protein